MASNRIPNFSRRYRSRCTSESQIRTLSHGHSTNPISVVDDNGSLVSETVRHEHWMHAPAQSVNPQCMLYLMFLQRVPCSCFHCTYYTTYRCLRMTDSVQKRLTVTFKDVAVHVASLEEDYGSTVASVVTDLIPMFGKTKPEPRVSRDICLGSSPMTSGS